MSGVAFVENLFCHQKINWFNHQQVFVKKSETYINNVWQVYCFYGFRIIFVYKSRCMKKLLVLFILFPLMLTGQKAAESYIESGQNKYLYQDDKKGAYEDFTRAIALDPTNAKAYMWRAETYTGPDQHAKCMADLDKAIDLSKTDEFLSDCYFSRGIENRNHGDLTSSIDDFSKGIEANPKKDLNYLCRGRQYLKINELEKAQKDFTTYLRLKEYSKSGYSFESVASGYADVKMYDKALEYIEKAIAQDNTNVSFYNSRADYKVKLNKIDGAIEDYNHVISLRKTDSKSYYSTKHAYFELGWLYQTNKKDETHAAENFLRSLEYSDLNINDLDIYIALLFSGQKEKAFLLFSVAMNKDRKQQNQYFLSDYYFGCVLHALAGNGYQSVQFLDSAFRQKVHVDMESWSGFENKYGRFLDNIKYRNDYKQLLAKYNIPYTVPPLPVADLIKLEVTQQMQSWQEKGEFETNAQYMARMKTRDAQVKKFTDQAINQLKKDQLDEIARASVRVGKYDAESETFKISFNDKYHAIVSVPISDAPSFRDNSGKLKYSKQDFMIQNDQWVLSNLTVLNPANQKQFAFDIRKQADYNPNQQFVLRYEDIKVDIPKSEMASAAGKQESSKQAKPIELGLCDVDVNIPASAEKNPNLFVIAIGNEDYARSGNLDETVNVPFARNDAKMFRQYAEKCLGAQSDHIRFLQDATLAQMKNAVNWIGEVAKVYSNAEIIFYYAGHGLPDDQQKESYLIPVDATPSDLSTAIKLSDVYSKLMRVPTQRVTVFLDACFSGGGRNSSLIAARSVKITPKPEEIEGKLVIFNATSGDQTALPYTDKQHGMFTYYLLKKIQESQGKATYKELSDYLSAKVSQQSIITNNKPQSPKTDLSPYVQDSWGTWTLR